MMRIPFSKVPNAGNELKYLQDVLSSGWLTTASKAKMFEQRFKNYIGVEFACAVNSCTSALHLAVEAIDIQLGDKILVPSLTFTATAEVIRYMGADPVFMDVEYGTGLITPEILENYLLKYTDIKAIILVHYGGQAVKLHTHEGTGIIDICRKRDIKIVEDAAHSFPTRHENKYVGSFGNVTCFSFYANKTITTGEGGMLVTNDESIYNRVKKMRLHGIDKDIWDRFTDEKPSWEYDVIAPGFKYNMPDINAAIGLAQLEKAEYFREQRQRCAEVYYSKLGELECVDLPQYYGSMEDQSWHLYPIIVKPESSVSRNEFIQQLADCGVGTSVHYKPLHKMTYYKEKYNLLPDDFPNTERIYAGTVSLPIYPDLKIEELDYICANIIRLLQ